MSTKTFDSGDEDLNCKINEWLEWDNDSNTKSEILNLAAANNWPVLKKRLSSRLEFGTAGLRGVMQAGYNSMNDLVVIQTAQGMAKYLLKCIPNESNRAGVVIGFDGRYNSERFAKLSACVFINEGIPVFLYGKTVATPFIPFAITEKRCIAGIMVTASHNPKEDNGYKVFWGNGAQIITPHDKNIQIAITQNLKPLPSSWDISILKSTSSELFSDPFDEMIKLYYEKLYNNIPLDIIESYNVKCSLVYVYSAMHGVGYPFVERAFEMAKLTALIPVEEQKYPDPEFSTVKNPNPEERSSLDYSMKLADELNVDRILANDPDADRLAYAERNPNTKQWKIFSGNELGALLGWWAVECYKMKNNTKDLSNCYMLSSTVSSKILHSICKLEGLNFIETLTGFKWMGNKSVELMADKKEVLFAFEEAIGFMCSSTVLDKDGVSAACHLATLSSYLLQTLDRTLDEQLNEIYKKYGYHISLTSYYLCYSPETMKNIFNNLRSYESGLGYPKSLSNGKYLIKYVRDLTTGVDTSQPDGKAILPTSASSQMITFTFENGIVLTLRTSGTEPKVKYYAEMCGEPGNENWNELRKITDEIVEASITEFLQPTKNGLIQRDA